MSFKTTVKKKRKKIGTSNKIKPGEFFSSFLKLQISLKNLNTTKSRRLKQQNLILELKQKILFSFDTRQETSSGLHCLCSCHWRQHWSSSGDKGSPPVQDPHQKPASFSLCVSPSIRPSVNPPISQSVSQCLVVWRVVVYT